MTTIIAHDSPSCPTTAINAQPGAQVQKQPFFVLQVLSARGVAGLSNMLKHHAERAPLKRNVEPREVGNTALFLCSSLSSGITGETIYVDCGYNVMGI